MAISTIGTDALAASAVTTTKLAAGAPSRSQLPAGTVLQVVQGTYSTETTTSSGTFVDTGLTATITPTSATSKVLVHISHATGEKSSASSNNRMTIRLLRGATDVVGNFLNGGFYTASAVVNRGNIAFSCLDSPASTSAQIYKTQFLANDGTNGVTLQVNGSISTIILMEIAA